MHLTKKINNNVALGTDSQGRDVVVFGKGVGFHRMPHEVTSSDVVEPDVLRAASDIVETRGSTPYVSNTGNTGEYPLCFPLCLKS